MAFRTIGNVNGAVGEAKVLGDLLRTGAAVNALTGDDTGWDLHMHLPTEPIESSKKWQLSGLIVHVQVKARRRGRTVEVGQTTLEGWVAGSRAGTPTFLILVSDVSEKAYRIDPHEMLRVGTPNKRGEVSLSARPDAPFDHRTFAYLADLWAHHGVLMMTIGENVEQLVNSGNLSDYRDHLLTIISELAASAVPLIEPTAESDDALLTAGRRIFPPLLSSLGADDLFETEYGDSEVFQHLVAAAPSCNGRWSDTIVKSWMISPAATWEEYSSDMQAVAKRIHAYVEVCGRIRPLRR